MLTICSAVSAADTDSPDLTVTSITPNSGAGDTMFANEPNVISVTVKNQGTASAPASTLNVNIKGTVYTANVPSLAAGASTTVTVTDSVSRSGGSSVSISATIDPDNSISEADETNNILSTTQTIYNNGYKSKEYTGGDDSTQTTLQGNYDIIYSCGNSAYNNSWSKYAVNWTAAQLPIPNGDSVVQARLYQSYTWDKTPGGQPLLNVNFNGNPVTSGAWYSDTKGFGKSSYPSGLFVYDVTSFFNNAGNVLTITPGTGTNTILYGSYLVVVYHDSNTLYKTIYINDGCDLLYSYPAASVNDTEATAHVNFQKVNNSNLGNAKVIDILASANGDGGANRAFFNGNVIGSFESDYLRDPQIGFSTFNVTDLLHSGSNVAGMQSYNNATKGDNMVALNSILVVSYSSPVSSFSADVTNGINSLTVKFTDGSTNTPTSWAWDFGDGTTSTQQNPTHTYSNPGKYTVKLTTTNAVGSGTVTKTDYITVNAPDKTAPKASANVKGGLYNTPKVITLKMSEAGSIYYTLNGATPTTSSKRYTGAFSVNSTHTLKFLAVDTAGNKSPVYTVKYTIDKTAPKVAAIWPKNKVTGVSKTKTVSIGFSENILKGVNWSKVYIKNLKTGKKFKATIWISGNHICLKTGKKTAYTWYQVYIPAYAVKDAAGNSLTKGYTFKFKTGR